MSEVTEWLEANSEALDELSSSTGIDKRLVHLVAILVLAGLDDGQIDAQLSGHGFDSSHIRRKPRLAVALREIRRLAA